MPRSRTLRLSALAAALLAATPVLSASPADAVTGSAGDTYAFTARLEIGGSERACSGALVDPAWVVSAASCFVDDPGSGATPAAGKPAQSVTVTVGRPDLTATTGLVTTVTELVPSTGGDLVMARLAKPASGITPVQLSTTMPTTGDTLTAVGFGRTTTEWAPTKEHIGSFNVDSVEDSQLSLSGQNGASICAGDAGGPLLREVGGTVELVGVSTRSWQAGCWGTDESEQRNGATGTRVDDVNAWVQQVRGLPQQEQSVSGDFDGDGKSDVAALYDYGKNEQGGGHSGLWLFKSDGTSYRAPSVAWDSGASSWTWASSKLTSGDYNGDGKDDIAVLYNNGPQENGTNRSRLWVFTSTGTGFQAPKVVWDSNDTTSWTWASSKLTSGDYNGDGKDDVAVLYNNGLQEDGRNRTRLWVFTSTGDTIQAPKVAWDSNDTNSWNWNASKITSGDYNGDGKDDVAVLYDYGLEDTKNHSKLWWAFTSTGTTFQAPKVAWDSGDTSWDWDASKITSGDYNGDGKDDVAVLYNYGLEDTKFRTKLWVFLSTGDTIQAPKVFWDSNGTISWNWNLSQPLSGDANGDNKDDLAVFYDYGTTADGRTRQGLWNFTSTGDALTTPHRDWDSAL